jgi:hypothetical protein
VDLEVPRSSRGGGTIKIKYLHFFSDDVASQKSGLEAHGKQRRRKNDLALWSIQIPKSRRNATPLLSIHRLRESELWQAIPTRHHLNAKPSNETVSSSIFAPRRLPQLKLRRKSHNRTMSSSSPSFLRFWSAWCWSGNSSTRDEQPRGSEENQRDLTDKKEARRRVTPVASVRLSGSFPT